MTLYIDIGNTNTKLHYELDNNKLYFSFPTHDINSPDQFINSVSKKIQEVEFLKVVISTTVPRVGEIVEEAVRELWNIEPFVLNHFINLGFDFEIDNPRSLGIDLLCLASFVSENSEDGVIVNLGTATTILQIQNKTLMGGIIAPGLMTSFNSLIQKAAKLHEMNLEELDSTIGKNTKETISIGVLQGHAHMIDGFVKNLNAKDVYISGGNSSKVSKYLKKYTFIKEATIEGMKILDKKNKA